MELEWKRNQPISVNTGAELEATLDSIEHDPERAEPVLAFLRGPTGFLSIGVGHPEVSVLMYGTPDRNRPLHAVGDEVARTANVAEPFLIFASYGTPYQLARWCGIPKKTAHQAARSFLEQGGVLWNGIRWEEEGHS